MKDKFKGITKETLISFISNEMSPYKHLELEELKELIIAFRMREKAFEAWDDYHSYMREKYDERFFEDYTTEEAAKYKRLRNRLYNADEKYNKLKEQSRW